MAAAEENVDVGARNSSYYYAFGDKKSDENFDRPKRIDGVRPVEEGLRVDEESRARPLTDSKWNASNYHWEEKDVLPRLEKEMSKKIACIDDADFKKGQGILRITNIESCEGYASRCVRKGKVIFVFELSVTVAWEGSLMGKDDEMDGGVFVNGKVTLPTFSHDDGTRPEPAEIVSNTKVSCDDFTSRDRRKFVEITNDSADFDGEARGIAMCFVKMFADLR